jgi:hypothetical protein
MKNRTAIRAKAKGCAELYATRGLSDVLVHSFEESLDRKLPHDTSHDWFAHVYTTGDYPEEFVGFKCESDAICFAHDVQKFGGLERNAVATSTGRWISVNRIPQSDRGIFEGA